MEWLCNCNGGVEKIDRSKGQRLGELQTIDPDQTVSLKSRNLFELGYAFGCNEDRSVRHRSRLKCP